MEGPRFSFSEPTNFFALDIFQITFGFQKAELNQEEEREEKLISKGKKLGLYIFFRSHIFSHLLHLYGE